MCCDHSNASSLGPRRSNRLIHRQSVAMCARSAQSASWCSPCTVLMLTAGHLPPRYASGRGVVGIHELARAKAGGWLAPGLIDNVRCPTLLAIDGQPVAVQAELLRRREHSMVLVEDMRRWPR